MAHIVIIRDERRAFADSVEDWKQTLFHDRATRWHHCATEAGWSLRILDRTAVLADPTLLGQPRAIFIDMPLLRRAEYRQLWATLTAVAPTAVIADPPADVERVQWLSGYWPAVQASGVPCVPTALLALTPEWIATVTDAAMLAREIGPALDHALSNARLDLAAGVYVRTFLCSTRETHPAYFYAQTREQLHAVAVRVLRNLRTHNDIGGLAIRAYLPLDSIALAADGPEYPAVSVNVEMRAFVRRRQIVTTGFHGRFAQLSGRQQADLSAGLANRAEDWADVRRYSEQLLTADLPPQFAVDFVCRRGGGVCVLEMNPYYSSGSNVPAVRAASVCGIVADLLNL